MLLVEPFILKILLFSILEILKETYSPMTRIRKEEHYIDGANSPWKPTVHFSYQCKPYCVTIRTFASPNRHSWVMRNGMAGITGSRPIESLQTKDEPSLLHPIIDLLVNPDLAREG